MKTNFTTLHPKKEGKKTVFTKALQGGSLIPTTETPEMFKNVLFIGNDPEYGDVFKVWDHERSFGIFMGVKGDEF